MFEKFIQWEQKSKRISIPSHRLLLKRRTDLNVREMKIEREKKTIGKGKARESVEVRTIERK